MSGDSAGQHQVELPRQVGGVSQAGAQTLPGERWRLVGGVAGEEHATSAPLVHPPGLEPVHGVTFEPRVVRCGAPGFEEPPRGGLVVQGVDPLARQRHELPAPPSRSTRHARGRARRVADLHVQGVEGARLVEDDVDDEPVVEERAVGHRHADEVPNGAVGAVAADDVAGVHRGRVARPADPDPAGAVWLDVDPFAVCGDGGAVVVEADDLDTPAHLHAGQLGDPGEQQVFELGLGEHRRLRPPRQATSEATEPQKGPPVRVLELVDLGGF